MSSLLQNKPKDEGHYLRLASNLIAKAEITKAIYVLEKGFSNFPENIEIINSLAKTLLISSTPNRAQFYFDKAREALAQQEKLDLNLVSNEDFFFMEEEKQSLEERVFDIEVFETTADKEKELRILTKKSEKTDVRNHLDSRKTKAQESGEEENGKLTAPLHFGEYSNGQEQYSNNSKIDLNFEVEDEEHLDNEGIVPSNQRSIDDLFEDEIVVDSIDEFSFGEVTEVSTSEPLSGEGLQENSDFEIYEFWDEADELKEELAQEDGSLREKENSALDNKIDSFGRARQQAISFIESVGWEQKDITLITEIFVESGWSATKRAIEREVSLGMVRNELELAYEVKKVWKECERYWITFSRVWAMGESTGATYRHCSWKQALRIVRLFDGMPVIEEIIDFLEMEFEYWYSCRLLRGKYKAFSIYLFSYRINSTLANIDIADFRRFGEQSAYDSLDDLELMRNTSAEALFLYGCGVDLNEKYAPKNYYYTDQEFDPTSVKVMR